MPHRGIPMTGRDPAVLARLIAKGGNDVWQGIGSGDADRGDRNYRPGLLDRLDRNDRQRKEPPMPNLTDRLATAVRGIRDQFDLAAVDPFDASVPGTVRRRIKAHNALLDIARIGRDRICGFEGSANGPCILKDGHADSQFDDARIHMDAVARDRAIRYLVHSDPDPDKRA